MTAMTISAARTDRPSRERVDAGPAVRRIRALMDDEYGIVLNIAAASGLSDHTIAELLAGNQKCVDQRTLRALNATPAARLRQGAKMALSGRTQQRVWSLRAQGWPIPSIARAAKLPSSTVRRVCARSDRLIRVSVRDAVFDVYELIGHQRGPSRREARIALAAGWHPAAAYDDDGTLIPEAIRDEALEARKEQREIRAQQIIDIIDLSLRIHDPELHGLKSVAKLTGTYHEDVSRIRRLVGIRFEGAWHLGAEAVRVCDESADRAAYIRRVIDEFRRRNAEYCENRADAFEIVRWRLGLMRQLMYNWDTPRELRDH